MSEVGIGPPLSDLCSAGRCVPRALARMRTSSLMVQRAFVGSTHPLSARMNSVMPVMSESAISGAAGACCQWFTAGPTTSSSKKLFSRGSLG